VSRDWGHHSRSWRRKRGGKAVWSLKGTEKELARVVRGGIKRRVGGEKKP